MLPAHVYVRINAKKLSTKIPDIHIPSNKTNIAIKGHIKL